MSEEINIEKIELYLSGQLSSQEKEDFEKEMAANSQLAAQVEVLKDLDTVLADEEALATQKVIQEVINNSPDANMPQAAEQNTLAAQKRPLFSRPWAIALFLLLLSASTFLLWQRSKQPPAPNTEQLFAQYYSAETFRSNIRGTSSQDSLYQLGIVYYQQKQFPPAIEAFNTFLQADATNWKTTYALAHAYLNLKQYKEAKTQFESIVADGKSILVPNSRWYLALIALKTRDLAAARTQLEILQSTAEDQQLASKASALLKSL